MMISITHIESAINYWRARSPANSTDHAVCQQVNCLADVYAMMIFERQHEIPVEHLTDMQKTYLAASSDNLPVADIATDDVEEVGAPTL